MDEWPDSWTRSDRRRMPPDTAVMPGGDYTRYGTEDAPYGPEGGGAAGGGTVAVRRRRWPRRLLITLLVLLLLVIGSYVYFDARLHRLNALGYDGWPGDTPGTNWLIVGSDSRQGLSKKQRHEFATGSAAGRRTDTMMLLHFGDGGATLVSLPRDSYLPIPGHGSNKLNAAYAFGGPRLLARTLEQATKIHIDHYAEIGFGGFVGMVDAVGGVRLCVKQPMHDPKAGLNLKPGCQTLNGGQALGYVRSRASARADLDRVRHQREFFGALVAKATGPGVLFNPFRSLPLASRATDNFAVDHGDHLYDLIRMLFAMKSVGGGNGVTTTVPIGGFGSAPGVGSFVRWDTVKAPALFDALRQDRPVPKQVISR